MPTWNRQSALLLVVISLLSACGSDSGFDEDTDFVVQDGFVQFINMMPDSPPVIMLHGLQRQTSVAFPQAEPIEIRAVDKYDWILAYLDSEGDEVTVAEEDNQQVSEDVLSTFLMMGSVRQPNIVVVDAPIISTSERPDGLADVWFASNLTNHTMVDIYLTEFGVDLGNASPITTVTSGGFTSKISVDAGLDRQLRITVAGTNVLLFDSGSIEVPEKTDELYGLVDDFGPNGEDHADVLRSLIGSGGTIRDESQIASVRVGNYSQQTVVNESLGNTVFPNVIRRTRSATQETANGVVDFEVTDLADNILEEGPATVARGTFQSVYTFENNTADATSVTRSLLTADSFRTARDRIQFKFINGSNEAVDLYVLRDGQDIDEVPPLLNDIGFSATDTRESITSAIAYVVRNAENTETLAQVSAMVQEGISYTLVFDTERGLYLLED